MNKATITYHGKQINLEADDTQMLQASIMRFSGSSYINVMRRVVLPPVRRILDVGACIGAYTLLFHEAWPDAEIWAIEPSSVNYHYLMLNTGHIPNVRHIPFAAGEATYTHEIAMPTFEQKKFCNVPEGNTGIMSMFGASDKYREAVPVVRLDDIIDWCDFIKIDVEGYEDRVISGAGRLLTTCRPTLHVEYIPQNRDISGTSAADLTELIQGFGYVQSHTIGQDRIFVSRDRVANVPDC
jgi:FkbM family methyltransferase